MGRTNHSWLVGMAVATALLAAHPASVRAEAPFEGPMRARVADDIDQSIRRHFAHWQGTEGLDYGAAFAAYRSQALAAPDRRAFSLLTQSFVARLNNGHTFFYDPALFADDPGLGFSLRQLSDGWVVIRSASLDLPTGALVTALDEQSVDAFYRQVRPLLSGSNERARRTIFTAYALYFPHHFTLALADGRRISIDRTAASNVAVSHSESFSARWLEPGTAYLRISSFSERSAERQASAALAGAYRDAAAVILDIRGNGGGTTPSRLGRQLLGGDWRSWRTTDPGAVAPQSRRQPPTAPRYIVIVDRGCASACEDFAMPFSLSARAIIIGETTMGTSGQPEIIRWSNDMEFWVSRRRQWFPDGRSFEGVGIEPDIPLDLASADFVSGAPDRFLDCALLAAHGRACAGRTP